ncbi:S-adenosyl-L-methionine-dependent methyltransferase [Mycena polygramma]|nr:S-adenosyl-L-methionine-dependent methyltransferase [Mycena polygramma]KAJ7608940.1 S-adenosyl-L-methionine-dependent methyltransferase [Mycena polygramma]
MSAEIPTTIPTDSLYAIPSVTPEKERLAKQYAMKQAVYGWTTAVPDAIDLSQIKTVLDIGAGTCIWALDLASAPEISARREDVTIHACDIDAGFFPPAAVTEEMGIKTFQQDMTKPFPDEYHGVFDLVHMSFVFLCLTEDGWKTVLANIEKLLKPGGRVMLDELDPVLFEEGQYSRPAQGEGYKLEEMMTGASWIHKLNSLYTGFIVRHGFVVGLTLRLGQMLERAGLAVEHVEGGQAPVGKLCEVLKAFDGGSLAEYTESSMEGLEFVMGKFVGVMRQEGTLEAPLGHPIGSEDELQSILAEVHHGLQIQGAICVGACFVARKV